MRTQFLDLDVLDSPVISLNSCASVLSSGPGSSIAEKIFNDPESWHDSDDTQIDDREMKDVMAWFAEELEKYGDHFGDGIRLSPIEQGLSDVKLKHFSGRYKLTQKPAIPLPSISEAHTQWEGVPEDDTRPFLPIFDRSGLDLSMDLNIRLSKIWDPGSTFSQQSLHSPIIFSPASSPSTGMPVKSSDPARTNVPPLDLGMQLVVPSTPLTSPVSVVSASTTWSILELYGVHPDTPDSGRPLVGSHPSSALFPVPPVTHPSTSHPINPPPHTLTRSTNETASIRPLPLIPDPVRYSPAPLPPRLKTPGPFSRKPSLRPSQPSNSPSAPPSVVVPQPREVFQPFNTSSAPSRLKRPDLSRKTSIPINSQFSQNSHSHAPPRMKAADLRTCYVSPPLLSEPVTPAAPSPNPSGPGSATRSPPLGPRPRSSMLPSQQR